MSKNDHQPPARKRQRRKPDGDVQRDDGIDRGDGRTSFGSFAEGVSGNTRGRPKGSRNASTIVREVFDLPMTMNSKDGPITVSRFRAIVEALFTSGVVNKNVRALDKLVTLGLQLEERDAGKVHSTPLSPADEAVIALIRSRMKATE